MPISSTYNPSAPAGRPGQGSGINNREDLDNKLTLLAATDFPITMLCRRGKAKSTLSEWPVDKLASPSSDGVPEGQDASAFEDAFSDSARLQNRAQRLWRLWQVSEEQEATDSAGPQDVARAKAKKMLELKRDIEFTIASDNDATTPSPGVAAKMRALGKWINNASPGSEIPDDYVTPSGNVLTAAPTEASFNGQIASLFSVNGQVNKLKCIVGATLRQAITGFTRTDNNASEAVLKVNIDAKTKEFTYAVNIYDSDFGYVTIINGNPDCMPAATRGYLLNPNYVELKTLRATQNRELENQGGGRRGIIDTILTLAVSDPRAHGKIAY